MVGAQITGYVTDEESGDTISFATISYKNLKVHSVADADGYFKIARHNGQMLTVTAVGYATKTITVNSATGDRLNIKMKADTKMLQNVTVKAKRQRYRRKNNPAVELMRRVIAAKEKSNILRHENVQWNQYQKITFSLDDITEKTLEGAVFKKHPWLAEQVEYSPYTQKNILPLNINETVTSHLYRKNPKSEKHIVMGETSQGVNQFFETGDILDVAIKDVFTDVDIYDDHVRLLQYPFTSPIGNDAISFYRYYIADTVAVERDSCYHLQFTPNNPQDFGFSGDLYILKDSTLHVRKVTLRIPKKSDVNFVNNLTVEQEYTQLPNGDWILSQDDMYVEMSLIKKVGQFLVVRNTRNQDYTFEEVPKRLFKGKNQQVVESSARMRDDSFWKKYRAVELTKSESSMNDFQQRIMNLKGFKPVIFVLKALIENFVETGKPSKIDIGPVNTIFTHNSIDGFRTRLTAQSTSNLSKHWFFRGYYAHGWGSKKNYYLGEVTYSFNEKDYLPREFPKRTITVSSSYDVCTPTDRFLPTDKDNFLVALRWTKVERMMFYNRQQAMFEWETENGFKFTTGLKTEENEILGDWAEEHIKANNPNPLKFRNTELTARVFFAPGETYINTKQRRLTINLDKPTFEVAHTVGFRNFLGSDYSHNYTEARIYKRFWLPHNWGKVDCYLKGGIEWNKVPYYMLLFPASNLSYVAEMETFNLINNMEFLNDRFASLMVGWDLNGKILNRLPLLRKLKWREFVGVNCLWGDLTDKNRNEFPDGMFVMDSKKPYVELRLGIHNIFKLVHVEYVRRLTYMELPTAKRDGFRIIMRMTF
jgi:hypothetical protein